MNTNTIDPNIEILRCKLQILSREIPSFLDKPQFKQRRIWAEMQNIYIILAKLMVDRILPKKPINELVDAYRYAMGMIGSLGLGTGLLAQNVIENIITSCIEYATELELYRVVANFKKFKEMI